MARQILAALLIKNFIYIKRNLCKSIFQLLYPCIFIGLVILMTEPYQNRVDPTLIKLHKQAITII